MSAGRFNSASTWDTGCDSRSSWLLRSWLNGGHPTWTISDSQSSWFSDSVRLTVGHNGSWVWAVSSKLADNSSFSGEFSGRLGGRQSTWTVSDSQSGWFSDCVSGIVGHNGGWVWTVSGELTDDSSLSDHSSGSGSRSTVQELSTQGNSRHHTCGEDLVQKHRVVVVRASGSSRM